MDEEAARKNLAVFYFSIFFANQAEIISNC
jgi:hypothetical protein